MDELLVETEATIERATEAHLRSRLREVDLGVTLVGVELQSAHAPAAVHSDYRQVASALIDTETLRLIEERDAAQSESDAIIQAMRQRAEAQREFIEVTAEATGRAAAFLELHRVDHDSMGAIRTRLQLEAQREAFEARAAAGGTIVAAPDEGVEVIATTNPERSMLDKMLSESEER